jgi:hypothetical protein
VEAAYSANDLSDKYSCSFIFYPQFFTIYIAFSRWLRFVNMYALAALAGRSAPHVGITIQGVKQSIDLNLDLTKGPELFDKNIWIMAQVKVTDRRDSFSCCFERYGLPM